MSIALMVLLKKVATFASSVEICKFRRVEIFDLKQHLAGHEYREGSASSGGPYGDPDPNKVTVRSKNSSHLSTGKEKAKGTL